MQITWAAFLFIQILAYGHRYMKQTSNLDFE